MVSEELADGTTPEDIIFVSFTRAAAYEARDRACAKFRMEESKFPWFRTLHSLCYKSLGLKQGRLFSGEHAIEFGKKVGQFIDASSFSNDSGMACANTNALGTVMLHIDNLSRTMMISLKEAWQHSLNTNVPLLLLNQFSDDYYNYKCNEGVYDFTDVLHYFSQEGEAPHSKVLFVDEAQDLSRLQWAVVEKLMARSDKVILAGDDDQAIYEWSGADVDTFLSLNPTRTIQLDQSHRLPLGVWQMADSVARRIHRRYNKSWQPRSYEEGGDVEYVTGYNQLSELLRTGNWLVLARNRVFLRDIEDIFMAAGYSFSVRGGGGELDKPELKIILNWERFRKGEFLTPKQIREIYSLMRTGPEVARGHKTCPRMEDSKKYSITQCCEDHGLRTVDVWYKALSRLNDEDREYYLSLLRNENESLSEPRIQLSTIHQAKGLEADNVLLVTDMSTRTARGMEVNMDAEHRVWYVAVSRAKEKLYILVPQTVNSYPLPYFKGDKHERIA